MSRSYHITRKAANRAMDAGDLGPTWQASEKSGVKKKTTETRLASQAIKSLTGREPGKVPNRAFVAKERARTHTAQNASLDLDQQLNRMLNTKTPE